MLEHSLLYSILNSPRTLSGPFNKLAFLHWYEYVWHDDVDVCKKLHVCEELFQMEVGLLQAVRR